MDHSSKNDQRCSSRDCDHAQCHGHEPDWENVGGVRREPNPQFFGLKWTYWLLESCCGRSMARYKEVQTRQCKI